MIQIRLAGAVEGEPEAVLRPVNHLLEPVTPWGQRVGQMAGDDVLTRLQGVGALPVGGAVITAGGGLPSPFLIHVVIQSGEEPVNRITLAKALLNGLRRATEWGVERLLLPPLGTGAGSLEVEVAARVMVETLQEHMAESEFPAHVVIAVANEYEEEVFTRELDRVVSHPPRQKEGDGGAGDG